MRRASFLLDCSVYLAIQRSIHPNRCCRQLDRSHALNASARDVLARFKSIETGSSFSVATAAELCFPIRIRIRIQTREKEGKAEAQVKQVDYLVSPAGQARITCFDRRFQF